jgi:hypothetical protein
VGQENLLTWPFHLADFGWGPVGAFASGQLLSKLGGIHNPLAFVLGLSVVVLFAIVFFHSWRQPKSRFVRPMVLIAAGYIISIVTLRTSTPFDAVSSPRTFLPILFALIYLLVTRYHSDRLVWLSYVAIGSIGLSVGLALRGMSPLVRPDLSSARAVLAQYIRPGDTVAVNGAASSLAAYFTEHFYSVALSDDGTGPIWSSTRSWNPNATTFTVIASQAKSLLPDMREFDVGWTTLLADAVRSGRAEFVHSNAESIILRARWFERAPRLSGSLPLWRVGDASNNPVQK